VSGGLAQVFLERKYRDFPAKALLLLASTPPSGGLTISNPSSSKTVNSLISPLFDRFQEELSKSAISREKFPV